MISNRAMLLAALALAAALLLGLCGCATTRAVSEDADGTRYEEIERSVAGVTVRRTRSPIPTRSEAAREGVRAPLALANRLSLWAALGGLGIAVALRQYGLQETGRLIAAGAGAIWIATTAALAALALLPWWLVGVAALATAAAALLAWLASGHGIDAWVAAKLKGGE